MKKTSSDSKKKLRPPAEQDSAQSAITQINLAQIPVTTNPHIQSAWVDSMNLFLRSDAPVAMLRFLAIVPPNTMMEVARIHTTTDHLKKIIDVLCKNLDHYPTKPRQS